jgi:hypothetical protein
LSHQHLHLDSDFYLYPHLDLDAQPDLDENKHSDVFLDPDLYLDPHDVDEHIYEDFYAHVFQYSDEN